MSWQKEHPLEMKHGTGRGWQHLKEKHCCRGWDCGKKNAPEKRQLPQGHRKITFNISIRQKGLEIKMLDKNLPYEIIDNRNHAEWLKARMYGIGGSDASAVLGMNPYKTNIELFEEKTGRRVPEDISDKPYVRYGTNAEPLIRALFVLDYPQYHVDYYENRILRSRKHPFMQASLDGELTDPDGRRGILEIKTTNILQSMMYEKWKDRIPDNYYIQVLHYLLVTGYEFVVLRAHLISEWGVDVRTTVKHYFIERSEVEADLQMLLREETKFWQYVESGRKPPLILPSV